MFYFAHHGNKTTRFCELIHPKTANLKKNSFNFAMGLVAPKVLKQIPAYPAGIPNPKPPAGYAIKPSPSSMETDEN